MSPGTLYRHLRIQDHLADLPVLEAESVQLSTGSSDINSVLACGRDLIIGRAQMEPDYISNVVLEPGWLIIMIPLGWRGDYVFNGQEARRYDFFVSSSRDGYVTRGKKRDNLGIGVREARLKAALRALSGRPHDNFCLIDQRLALSDDLGWALQRQFLNAIEAALYTAPRPAGRGLLPKTIEGDIIEVIAHLLLSPTGTVVPAGSMSTDALQIVRCAQRAYDHKPPHLVTLEDLCRAAGVGHSWLHKCFLEIYGLPPMRYQRMYRIQEARNLLQDPINRPRSVKDVALFLGFINGGRFAADYKNLFGEKPSESFARNSAT